MQRRDFLKTCVHLGLLATATSAETGWAAFSPAVKFDYAGLKGQAQTLATLPYQAPVELLSDAVKNLSWDQYQSIHYRADHALWAKQKRHFEVRFFHLGLFFKTPVRMYEVVTGQAFALNYDAAMFDYGNSGLQTAQLPKDLGFAGFQLFYHTDFQHDIAAFLGASYFRAVSASLQYGISARGLAIDTGMAYAEEFPRFTAFWFERPTSDADSVTIYALLDSPSITGAYRFVISPAARQVMDVDVALYPRKPITHLGIAPLTSMFLYGENDNRLRDDWRPEIHDSDGLAIWNGNGEWIWRPLTNPTQLRFNAYMDVHPRGFGLLQRDRNFDHYQDDGVFYERRPSVWVEPRSDWGMGSVQMVEISSPDETSDNMVAFWHPEIVPQPGQEYLYAYRLYWGNEAPFTPPLAQVVSTRTGMGGVIGKARQYFSWRFVVDFAGGDLAMLSSDAQVQAVISVTSGQVELTSVRPLASVHGLRAIFDLMPDNSKRAEPVNLRLYLSLNGQPLSETWLYQWLPPN